MTRRNLSITVPLLLIALAACGAGEDQGAADTAPAEPAETSATTASTSAASGGIQTADTDVGTILVDADDFALYAFTPDSDGESTCYDECADLWPPIPADTPIAPDLDASMFGTTARTDGSEQLTVNGQPLYAYSGDTNPGEAAGQGVNDVWFVVGTDGAIIGATSNDDTTSTTIGDGYSY